MTSTNHCRITLLIIHEVTQKMDETQASLKSYFNKKKSNDIRMCKICRKSVSQARKLEKSITSRPSGREMLCKELDDYILEPNEPENSNSFNWWSVNKDRFPNVAVVARAYLAIPVTRIYLVTSVASERIFSKCSLAVSDRWSN